MAVRRCALSLWLLLSSWAVSDDKVRIVLHTRPARVEVWNGERNQRYCSDASKGFLFDRDRLRGLTHLRVILAHPGYRSHVESIDAEVVRSAPTGGEVRWPPGEALIQLSWQRPNWLFPGAALALAGLLAAGWRAARRTPRSTPQTVTETPPKAPWELYAGQNIAQYTVEERLGEGVTAVVYRVSRSTDTGGREQLALKLLKPGERRGEDYRPRFLREMKALSRLRHANIPYLVDFGEHQDMLFLVMELLDGQDLKAFLQQGLPSLAQALDWLLQITQGLSSAHQAGVLHRDIKPENVLVVEHGKRIKITDFGLARAHDSTTLTVEGALLGTPAYMAPEIVGGQPSSAATDQYSLGCLALELLTGSPPYQGDNPLAVAVQQMQGPLPGPERIGHLPEVLQTWLLRTLAKQPEQRFANLEAAAAELRLALH